MSTGAVPNPQQPLSVSLPPQTPHVQAQQQQQQQQGNPMVPSSSTDGQLVVQGNQAQLHMIRQRQYFMQQQFAAAAAAAATARSGSGRTTPVMMQQVPPSPAHVQQELSPQPNGLVHNTNNRAAVVPQQQQQASVTPGYPLPTTSLTTGLITNQKLQVTGQAILRLLQFAELISPGAQQAISPIFWKEFVNGFFTESSTFKLGLWSNQKNMQEIYEMTRSSIPGYFHTQYNRCKVISMQLTVQGTDEKLLQDGSITIDCAHTSLIHRYENGGMVVSTGTLSVLFRRRYETNELRIDWMQFKCQRHEEFIERKRVNEIMAKFQPPKAKQFKAQQAAATAAIQSSINEWGVSTILYTWLKISDTMGRLDYVMFYSLTNNVGPKESTRSIAYHATHESLQGQDRGQVPGQGHGQQGQGQPEPELSNNGVSLEQVNTPATPTATNLGGVGGGKMKVPKREPKPKEERPKLTRKKTSRTKQSNANNKKNQQSNSVITTPATERTDMGFPTTTTGSPSSASIKTESTSCIATTPAAISLQQQQMGIVPTPAPTSGTVPPSPVNVSTGTPIQHPAQIPNMGYNNTMLQQQQQQMLLRQQQMYQQQQQQLLLQQRQAMVVAAAAAPSTSSMTSDAAMATTTTFQYPGQPFVQPQQQTPSTPSQQQQ